MKKISYLISLLFMFIPGAALASSGSDTTPFNLHLTSETAGIIALMVFVIAYILVIAEEFLHLRKSKPVLLAAGIIWAIIGWVAHSKGLGDSASAAVKHNILEYAELMLFLLVAMTYVNALEERQVFDTLRSWLVRKGFSFRQLFWITGTLAFFISPIADNLTTALLMCAVVMAVGGTNTKFITLGCINIVVAANAGGAFSPFGDITTLMVWQKGIIPIQDFLKIFIPSVVSYVIPAGIMYFALPNEKPAASDEIVTMKKGAKRIIALFILTIATAVSFHNFLELPPMLGMMAGLALLQFMGYYLKIRSWRENTMIGSGGSIGQAASFDVFRKIERVEWDTLLFFYGVILCVGGLATIGYLAQVSETIYLQWGTNLPEGFTQTPANVLVGFLSAIVDNIPVMFAVLTMNPAMSEGQWLLVTLTAGVGGSMLSIGSAAGVALMGQSKGTYTFFGHLKWSWAIMLGYIAAVAAHLWINYSTFFIPSGAH